MVWQLFSCLVLPSLSCHSICQSSTLGRAVASTVGCKEVNEGESGVRCLQRRVESAPPTIEAVVEGASPAHFGSLFVSTHVAYYVNYFAGQKTTTGQDKEREGKERGRGSCLRPRHIGLSSAQRGLVMLKWAHKAILTVLCFF